MRGEIPLVVALSRADVIGTLIKLKEEVESVRESKKTGRKLRWIMYALFIRFDVAATSNS